jgi:hypothetical protein
MIRTTGAGRGASYRLLLWSGALMFGVPASARSAEASAQELETRVRALLETHCYRCHSHQAGKSKGDLFVDSRAALLKGGETGSAFAPGHPEKSLVMRAVGYEDENLRMPPKGKLAVAEIALLRDWIARGAPWAESAQKHASRAPGKITDEDRRYWAIQPVREPPLPEGSAAHPLDRFIFARLAREGLTPAPLAERRALIRRVSFDLLGLPPTPAEVEAFVADTAADAYERLVERLLASPHYGERWARHWLDVVRFAESDGFRLDGYRPHAWRYRDYVVRAFNSDKPYDQFVREQLAGDELGDPEALAATGYLCHGIYEYNQRNVRAQWNDMINEITDVTGEAFLGLGVGCARCHDHKFDPFLQKDYFSLRAFFEGLLPSQEVKRATPRQQADYERRLATWERKTAKVRAEIEALEAPERDRVEKDMVSKFPGEITKMLLKPSETRTPLEQQLATLAYRQVQYEFDHIDARVKGEAKTRLKGLLKELARFDAERPEPLPLYQVVREAGREAAPTRIPKKTNQPPVPPLFPTIFGAPAPTITPPADGSSTGRRSALARWLTSPEHPLTARVIVNRVWHFHFGRGLVATTNDFGHLGETPTHPELLDWLAYRFMADGWSIKKLHRLILTSHTYRQAAAVPLSAVAMKKDPENRLLARMNTRRLDAEQIRDALLAITGKLDRSAGGASVDFKQPRRSVYLKVLRNTHEPLLEVFDLPESFVSAGRRNVTTTPTQALLLMNAPMVQQHAKALAERLTKEAGGRDPARIELAFRLAFGRPPTAPERGESLAFLEAQAQRVSPGESAEGVDPRRAALIDLCQVLLNANEFLYVD